MAKAKKKTKRRIYVVKVKDYGDDWINRLGVLLDQIEKMGKTEREATLDFILAKYCSVHY